MVSLEYDDVSIIIRGKISDWTSDIVEEYKSKFINSEIIVSTWDNEDTQNIFCTVVKSKEPKMPFPHKSTLNHQVILAKEGLKKASKNLIMVCRTDQFIHGQNIFTFFNKECPKSKILVTTFPTFLNGTPKDYRYEYGICDFCQIGTSDIIHEFWDNVPFFDGSESISAARTLVKNYVRNLKKDKEEWEAIKKKYFLELDYYKFFKIEWEKPVKTELYANLLSVEKLIQF